MENTYSKAVAANTGDPEFEEFRDTTVVATAVGARSNNEDGAWVVEKRDTVNEKVLHALGVADGMGGYEGGEIAADIAVRASYESALRYRGGKDQRACSGRTKRAFEQACRKMGLCANEGGMHRKAGTTLAVIQELPEHLYLAYSGDSRLGVFDPETGLWAYESHDQSVPSLGELNKVWVEGDPYETVRIFFEIYSYNFSDLDVNLMMQYMQELIDNGQFTPVRMAEILNFFGHKRYRSSIPNALCSGNFIVDSSGARALVRDWGFSKDEIAARVPQVVEHTMQKREGLIALGVSDGATGSMTMWEMAQILKGKSFKDGMKSLWEEFVRIQNGYRIGVWNNTVVTFGVPGESGSTYRFPTQAGGDNVTLAGFQVTHA